MTCSPQVLNSASIQVGPGNGWTFHKIATAEIHVRGYVFDGLATLTGDRAARYIGATLAFNSETSDDQIRARLADLSGHFATIIVTKTRTIATVDRIRSFPILFAIRDDGVLIDDRGRRLRDQLGLASGDIDRDQALAVAMAGYSIGRATLYRGLEQLRAGEALLIDRGGARTMRWFLYDAWQTSNKSNPEKELSELHRFIIERLARSASGRPIAVPLSAGFDSRMIASGLKEVGYRNVVLFSYGRAGNHEALTARRIAEHLGYPWHFVPFTNRGQRRMFSDAQHERALWQEADTCGGVPFEQDWTAIQTLRANGVLPHDCLIVNGQSGDFITGNHAPQTLMDMAPSTPAHDRERLVLSALLSKHYRLWRALATPENDDSIAPYLASEARQAGATFATSEALHGIHEMIEYQDRQAKYVVSGQRTYDALGIDWRLPLWDDEYILFWRRAEADLKRNQSLYRQVLERDNWGGVWKGIAVNAKTIRPRWIIAPRLVAKVAFAPLGRERWQHFERRAFQWWMDPLRVSAVVPYNRAVRSSRGARHAVAWIAERYLGQHGIPLETFFNSEAQPA